MFTRIETEAFYPSCFNKPFGPLVEVFDHFWVFEVDISVHEVIIVAVFAVDQIILCPTFVVPLDLVNPTLIAGSIVVGTGEVVPVPMEVIVGCISTIKGKFGPSFDSKRLSQDDGPIVRVHFDHFKFFKAIGCCLMVEHHIGHGLNSSFF